MNTRLQSLLERYGPTFLPSSVIVWTTIVRLLNELNSSFFTQVNCFLGSVKVSPVGYSARWMFMYTIDQIKKATRKYLDQAPDPVKLFTRDVGVSSISAANHLLFGTTIVSEYVTELYAQEKGHNFIRVAMDFSRKNEAFDGWILELDFKFRVMQHRPVEVFDSAAPLVLVKWPCQLHIEYTSLDELPDKDQKDSAVGLWLIPKRFNHPCFDFLAQLEIGWWHAINSTCNKKHSIKPKSLVCSFQVKLFPLMVCSGHHCDGAKIEGLYCQQTHIRLS